jgi:hypothetical protein
MGLHGLEQGFLYFTLLLHVVGVTRVFMRGFREWVSTLSMVHWEQKYLSG